MRELINLQCTIFLLVGTGFFLRRIRLVSREGQKCITDLVIYVILPCNIVKAFCMDFTDQAGGELVTVLFLSMAVQAVCMGYGKIMFRKQTEGRRKCLLYGTICSNAGFLGNPVAEGIYGTYGLLLASFFLIPQRIMMWTEGVAIFSGSRDSRSALKKAVLHPCVLACVTGIFLMLTGLRPPAPVAGAIAYLGACNTAFSMLVIGMILSDMDLKTLLDKTAWRYCVHRLVILPLLFYVLIGFLPVSSTVRGLVVLLTAMPAGATTSILAAKYNMEPEFSTKLVICSTLLSLPSLTVWSMLLQ